MVTDYNNTTDFDCRLCVEINDFENSLFAQTYPDLLRKNSFFETDFFQVMIPVGPFCEGHVLIAAKKHLWSFGHAERRIISELGLFIDKLSNLCETHYGRIIAFEHGPMSNTKRGGCCLEHAHINLMPVPDTFNAYNAASKFLNFTPCELVQLTNFVEQDIPYIFFKCRREGSFAAFAPEGTSQFFRKLVSSETDRSEWDWRSADHVDFVKATVTVLNELEKKSSSLENK